MIRKEDFAGIKALAHHGMYLKDIAHELCVHPRTVSRALQRNGAPERGRQSPGSKLNPHKATIDRLLAEGVWNAKVIWREIQAEGYTGRYTKAAILRRILADEVRLPEGQDS